MSTIDRRGGEGEDDEEEGEEGSADPLHRRLRDGDPPGTAPVGSPEDRLAAVEREVAALGREVRTDRLVVVDRQGHERIVAEVVDDNAEIRVQLYRRRRGAMTAVVLYACPEGDGLDGGIGLQLWGEGDSVAEIDAWPVSAEQWRVVSHLVDQD